MSSGNSESIRRALPEDAGALSALAFRSKAHWGYSDEFMRACRAELTLSPDDIETHPTFVVELHGEAIGFYTLERLSDDEVELGYLFVEAAAIGRGHGRRLIEHAKAEAVGLGVRTMGSIGWLAASGRGSVSPPAFPAETCRCSASTCAGPGEHPERADGRLLSQATLW